MNPYLRIVKLNIVDIVYDPRHAGEVIAKACRARSGAPMRATGCCDLGGTVCIPLASAPDDRKAVYYFSVFPDSSEETVVSEMNIRYMSDMLLLGSFRYGDNLWGFWMKETD